MTYLFVHGIMPQPRPEEMTELWLEALAKNDGPEISSDDVIWCYYALDCFGAYKADFEASIHQQFASTLSFASVLASGDKQNQGAATPTDQQLDAFLEDYQLDPQDKQENAQEVDRLIAQALNEGQGDGPNASLRDLIGDPSGNRVLVALLGRYFWQAILYRDNGYRESAGFHVREHLRQRFGEALTQARERADANGTELTVVAHSLGAVIAWDYLLDHSEMPVDHLITFGSPLPIQLFSYDREWRKRLKTPWPENVRRWSDSAIKGDLIVRGDGLQQVLFDIGGDDATEARKKIKNYAITGDLVGTTDKLQHEATTYLRQPLLRRAFCNPPIDPMLD